MQDKPLQKIYFGNPGTGKSHKIDTIVIPSKLDINNKSNVIKTVFHPEYTYGDFMGKLLPISRKKKTERKVEYNYYTGHFLKAIARSYRNIIDTYINEDSNISDISTRKPDNVVLVIDEINRGNSAAIFGTVFQLLDRESDGWSSYGISLSNLEYEQLLYEIGIENKSNYNENDVQLNNNFSYNQHHELTGSKKDKLLECLFVGLNKRESLINNKVHFTDRWIYLPPNLSLLATMNTSDNSIYFMDGAFKRRWDWEFVDINDNNQKDSVLYRQIIMDDGYTCSWTDFVDKLNQFIIENYKIVRRIEEKQIGYRFINEEIITESHLKNKLMFFLWDSVFTTNKRPLSTVFDVAEQDMLTFGQFIRGSRVKEFITKIMSK